MKRIKKEITLKKDTLNDIRENNIDTDKFIERINDYLENANYLINNKMVDMSKEELYQSLSKIFYIYYEPNDYIKMLALMNNKRYTRFVNINTNMFENDYNVSYLAVATNKVRVNDHDTLDLKKIRQYTDSSDLLLLRPRFIKKEKYIGRKEPYESHLNNIINVNNGFIDEDSEFYPYACELLKKELIIKYALYDIKLYVDEVLHQAKEVTSLSKIEDDEALAKIGKKYKKAYEKATNDSDIPKKEKVSVRYHQKTKKKKK